MCYSQLLLNLCEHSQGIRYKGILKFYLNTATLPCDIFDTFLTHRGQQTVFFAPPHRHSLSSNNTSDWRQSRHAVIGRVTRYIRLMHLQISKDSASFHPATDNIMKILFHPPMEQISSSGQFVPYLYVNYTNELITTQPKFFNESRTAVTASCSCVAFLNNTGNFL